MVSEAIIVGGGSSIKQADRSNLSLILASKFTILTNYSFKHFDGTFLTFVDRDFYKTRDTSKNPDIYEELKKLQLIVGIRQNGVEEFKLSNTILVNLTNSFNIENNRNNIFYSERCLTGIFALSLTSYLMNYVGKIFLLGFDWTKEGIDTHYYSKEEINHRGLQWIKPYKTHSSTKAFAPFNKLSNLKIYNVSLDSNIDVFEKISYVEFFNKLNNEVFSQEELRQEIRRKLCIS